METTQKVNLRAVINGKLKLLSLTDYLEEYLKFQKTILRKKTEFILSKYKNELHILEGYFKCISNIDKVIEIIKKAKL